jgi:hypothetical protein
MEMEAQNIVQWYAIFFCASTTHGKLQQAFGEHKPFAGTKFFLKAETLLKMSSTADHHQQHGEVTTQHR